MLDRVHAAPLLIDAVAAADVLAERPPARAAPRLLSAFRRPTLSIEMLTAGTVGRFLAEYRDDRGRLPGASAWPLLEYLCAEGAVPPEPRAVVAPVEQLLGEYREWLPCERGLARVTVRASERLARRFLAGRVSLDDPRGVRQVLAG